MKTLPSVNIKFERITKGLVSLPRSVAHYKLKRLINASKIPTASGDWLLVGSYVTQESLDYLVESGVYTITVDSPSE